MGLRNFLLRRKKEKFRKKHKIGLCLGGGGTRGLSYVGVFKAFEEYGIKFDAVAGTSIGSLFGAMYASGMKAAEMEKWAMAAKESDFRKSKLGFLPSKMDNLAEKINQVLPNKKIEDLLIPYFAVAVDVRTGEEKHFDSGDLAPIITGSCAIPGVFCPVKYKNMVLVDGGVSNNIPADVLRINGCDIVITVDCNCTRGGGTSSNSLVTQFVTSVGIMMANNSKKGIKLSDFIICPDLKRFSSLKLQGREEMIKEGYNATVNKIDEIKEIMSGCVKK